MPHRFVRTPILRPLLAFILSAGLAGSALAVTPDEVVARWGADSVPTSGRFTELRTIPGFPKPLRSEDATTRRRASGFSGRSKSPFPRRSKSVPTA